MLLAAKRTRACTNSFNYPSTIFAAWHSPPPPPLRPFHPDIAGSLPFVWQINFPSEHFVRFYIVVWCKHFIDFQMFLVQISCLPSHFMFYVGRGGEGGYSSADACHFGGWLVTQHSDFKPTWAQNEYDGEQNIKLPDEMGMLHVSADAARRSR